MTTRRVRIQLAVFLAITLAGVSFVGARYAKLDRLLFDRSYTVVAHFADSGGIFEGAEVSYRGVEVGRVGELQLTEEGVDVLLDIDDDQDRIPADTFALVGNRSAVGEQYVELQPTTDRRPYLRDRSEIDTDHTAVPISSSKWLLDTDRLVNSVDQASLKTTVTELGSAFYDTGEDLGRIIDTSTSFIQTADANFDVTRALIRDSNQVLRTQLDKASAIRRFSRNLALVSDTLAASDGDLRTVIANGSATADELRTFLERNDVDLAQLLNNLVTTGEITVKHLDGLEMVLVLYPYVVAGAYVVVDRTEGSGMFDAHFGMVLTQEPGVCHAGYDPAERRPPQNGRNRAMDRGAHCAEPADQSNPRGAQHAPRVAPGTAGRVVASYDRSSGSVSYLADDAPGSSEFTYDGGAAISGRDSWKWLLLAPLVR